MLRTSFASILLVALGATADAHPAAAPMDAVEAGTQGCAAARALVTDSSMALDGGRCKKLTSAKVKDVGAADVYRISDGDDVRYALEITDAHGARWMSALDLDAGHRTPRLRVIQLGGRPAFALDIASRGEHAFLVCGEHGGAWSCAASTIELGATGAGKRCKASLSDDGNLHTTCTADERISLR